MTNVTPGFAYDRIAVAPGVALHTAVGGSGDPIVLLRGFPQTHLMWRHVAADHTPAPTAVKNSSPSVPGMTFVPGPPSQLLVLHGEGTNECVHPYVSGNVIQRGCPEGNGDRWPFRIAVRTVLADPGPRLEVPGEGLCLTLPPRGAAQGARALMVKKCRDSADTAQTRRLAVTARVPGGFVCGTLPSQADDSLCANINGAQTGDDAALVAWTCGADNPPNQRLRLQDGSGRI